MMQMYIDNTEYLKEILIEKGIITNQDIENYFLEKNIERKEKEFNDLKERKKEIGFIRKLGFVFGLLSITLFIISYQTNATIFLLGLVSWITSGLCLTGINSKEYLSLKENKII